MGKRFSHRRTYCDTKERRSLDQIKDCEEDVGTDDDGCSGRDKELSVDSLRSVERCLILNRDDASFESEEERPVSRSMKIT